MTATQPVDIVNRAFDECGIEAIGDMQDGSKAGRAAERIYWPTVRELLSAAHWNFARKQETLVLMADASGQYSPNTDVPTPWSYMYEWPDDCVGARFVPATMPADATVGSIPMFSTPPGPSVNYLGFNMPTPFLVTSADRPGDVASNWFDVEGHSPEQTKVILTNQIGAQLVYTGLMQYPDYWDALFQQAVVAALSARFAMPLIPDRKEARVVRADNITIAKMAIDAARVRDGDEGWNVSNHTPDWIRARFSGGVWNWDGPGVLFYSWSTVGWLDGGSY